MTTITAASTLGIVLSSTIDTDPVVIAPTVSISVGGQAVFGSNVPWTLQNEGTVFGTKFGIFLGDGGVITNAASAVVSGGYDGVEVLGGIGLVTNYGAISGTGGAGIGIFLDAGGSVTNAASAALSGVSYGVFVFGGPATIANYGNLASSGAGIGLSDGGSITNAASATIQGTHNAITISGAPGTIINDGIISGDISLKKGGEIVNQSGGTIAGVSIASAAAATVVDEPGATFTGVVNGGGNAASTLELASGASSGTITGIGSEYINFPRIVIDTSSTWSISADSTIAASQTIVFAGSGAYLHLQAPGGVSGRVTNFAAGDTIDLKGVAPSSVTLSSGVLRFTGGSFPLALSGASAIQALPSADGTDVTVLCFCVNTLIQTPTGQVPVQHLSIGDHVQTASGTPRPIIWIGKGKVLATRGRRSAATPVIVRKHALADNMPNQDLHLTKGHALYLDGMLIPVEELVNHRTIEWDDRAQEVEVFHIELATHDVLIANGAPAESYRDDGNRWLFQNAISRDSLPLQPPCAPVVTDGPIVDAIWRRLLDRAGPRKDLVLTEDPDAYLLVDGKRINPIDRHGDELAFRLPAHRQRIRICSHSAIPQELGLARDPRRLGIAVRRIVLALARGQRTIEADSTLLADGFHAFEPGNGLRWTNGDAAVPTSLFAQSAGPGVLVLHLGASMRYPNGGRSITASAA